MALDYIEVLNQAQQGLWHEAHQQVQPYSNTLACLIHGYLHRVEGDFGNAGYWYSRAGEEMPNNTLAEEWQRLYRLTTPE